MQRSLSFKTLVRWVLPALAVLLLLAPVARADWVLGDWSAYIDGSTFNPPPLPASVNAAGFDFTTGLGTLVFSYNAAGPHAAGVYLYPYYDGGFGDVSDAYGTAVGSSLTGASYQFGWPGVPDGSNLTVFDRFSANTLDGSNTVGAYSAPPNACCTLALALIQAFSLGSGETATVTFTANSSQPGSGFYLQATDHDSNANYYLTESLTIHSPGGEVPEPGFWLPLAGCAGALWASRLRKAKNS